MSRDVSEIKAMLLRLGTESPALTRHPGKSYEQGVRDALRWVACDGEVPKKWPWVVDQQLGIPTFGTVDSPSHRVVECTPCDRSSIPRPDNN